MKSSSRNSRNQHISVTATVPTQNDVCSRLARPRRYQLPTEPASEGASDYSDSCSLLQNFGEARSSVKVERKCSDRAIPFQSISKNFVQRRPRQYLVKQYFSLQYSRHNGSYSTFGSVSIINPRVQLSGCDFGLK